MASGTSKTDRRERLELAGDGGLVTAAIFAVLTAIALVALTVFPQKASSDNIWVALAGVVMSLGGAVAGPVLAWWLHGRTFDPPAVIGGVLGSFLAGPVFMLGALLSVPMGWILSPFTRSEFAGPVALLVIFSVALLVAVVLLVADALRDLGVAGREHRSVDYGRLVAAIVIVAFTAGVAVLALRPGEGEMFEALIFMFLAGVGGALALFGADLAQRLDRRGKNAPAPDAPA